ncbi:hypothetical protein GALMADRAFT_223420 [Galerina marginata CBS 339.88]|uniref:SMP-30/Gluconolactonase/LRE-like region domain-containing protein n=1 Tax=Galerina marginata (strain CBS 339.88) TaxID=685588 RepID=A0A067TGY2_GALM3|nr:hypothetical protein GALMADRAFT_223420 [Galerina marginata CBS 339.88]
MEDSPQALIPFHKESGFLVPGYEMKLPCLKGSLILLLQAVLASAQVSAPKSLPSQVVFVDPRSFSVLGQNATFRDSSFTLFNPSSTQPPFFQIFDPAFLTILGPSPSLHEVASNATFAFAHEAPVYVPETDEVFFASNDGGALGNSDVDHNNQVGKISMLEVEEALQGVGVSNEAVNVPIIKIDLPDTIQMTNGGTGPFKSSLVFVTSGRGPLPPSIALVDPKNPENTTILLDNFFGRQFNSLNDVKIHPKSGAFFFTDTISAFLHQFRPPPLMPNQVYRLDPLTGAVRIVATDFDKCNGIAFSPDGEIAYIGDTGASGGFLGNNQTEPATIFVYDVDSKTQAFLNRRIFAYADTGIPDGLEIDSEGNVYAGCGDGVHVWSPGGTLLGKFFVGSTSANMVFAGDGRLVILAETKIFVAKIAAKASMVAFP